MHIDRYEQDRNLLLPLFNLADDSPAHIATYILRGEVLVASDDDLVIGHLQVLKTGEVGVFELKSMAVMEARHAKASDRAS